jgi:hypothetical protein
MMLMQMLMRMRRRRRKQEAGYNTMELARRLLYTCPHDLLHTDIQAIGIAQATFQLAVREKASEIGNHRSFVV